MKILYFTFLLVISLTIQAFSQGTNTGTGKYKLKSGIVTYSTEIMGMKQTVTQCFDEYGVKEMISIVATMDIGAGDPVQVNNVVINKDGFVYSVDMVRKEGTKTKQSTELGPSNMDFSKVDETTLASMNMKKDGSGVVMGKNCDKFSMDSNGIKATFWVWNGLALKTVMNAMGMETTMEVTKLEENVKIPASKFEIPADVKITDL